MRITHLHYEISIILISIKDIYFSKWSLNISFTAEQMSA